MKDRFIPSGHRRNRRIMARRLPGGHSSLMAAIGLLAIFAFLATCPYPVAAQTGDASFEFSMRVVGGLRLQTMRKDDVDIGCALVMLLRGRVLAEGKIDAKGQLATATGDCWARHHPGEIGSHLWTRGTQDLDGYIAGGIPAPRLPALRQFRYSRVFDVTGTLRGDALSLSLPAALPMEYEVDWYRGTSGKPGYVERKFTVVRDFRLPDMLGRIKCPLERSTAFNRHYLSCSAKGNWAVRWKDPADTSLRTEVTFSPEARFHYSFEWIAEETSLDANADRDIILGAPVPAAASRDPKKKGFESGIEGGPDFNIVRFKIPDTASNRAAAKADKLKLRASIASSGGKGLLFRPKPGSNTFPVGEPGRQSLTWSGSELELGKEQIFYYRWVGDPPRKLHNENIQLEVGKYGKTASREIRFEVGIDMIVTNVEFEHDRNKQTHRYEPILIGVKDGFRPGKSVADTLKKLKLAPVVLIRQCEFDAPGIDGLLAVFDWTQRAYEVDHESERRRPSIVRSDLYAWPLSPRPKQDGKGERGKQDFVIGSPAEYPGILFYGLGTHRFVVDVVGYIPAEKPLAAKQSTLDGYLIAFRDPNSVDYTLSYSKKSGNKCPSILRFEDGEVYKQDSKVFQTIIQWVGPGDAKGRALWFCTLDAIGVAAARAVAPQTWYYSIPALLNIADCFLKGVNVVIAGGSKSGDGSRGGQTKLFLAGALARQVTEAPGKAATDVQVASDLQALLKTGGDVQFVLIGRDGLDAVSIRSETDGKLQAAPTSLKLGDRSSDKASVELPGPARRIQESQHFILVPARPGEKLHIDLKGRGGSGSVFVITPEGIKRAAFPSGDWQAGLLIGGAGGIGHDGGASLVTSAMEPPAARIRTAFPGASSKPAGPDRPSPAASEHKKPVIGACRYEPYPGSCIISRIASTPASAAQARVGGGPGYAGVDVSFLFRSRGAIASPEIRRTVGGRHALRLTNSWYPGPLFLRKYRIRIGKRFACTARIRTAGACTPVVFDFRDIDLNDLSEAR